MGQLHIQQHLLYLWVQYSLQFHASLYLCHWTRSSPVIWTSRNLLLQVVDNLYITFVDKQFLERCFFTNRFEKFIAYSEPNVEAVDAIKQKKFLWEANMLLAVQMQELRQLESFSGESSKHNLSLGLWKVAEDVEG